MTERKTDLYFEAHVTFEPVFGKRLEELALLAAVWGFRVADLLMKKREEDTPERSKYDTFCSSRDTNYENLFERTIGFAFDAAQAGFVVWRYKIEDTLLDVRLGECKVTYEQSKPQKDI